jgi:DNA-directed RNA polymerase subunit K/omega
MSWKIPKKFEARYAFINVAATRARQIQNGAKPKTKTKFWNAAYIAMKEAEADLIEWDFLVEEPSETQVPPSPPALDRVVNA